MLWVKSVSFRGEERVISGTKCATQGTNWVISGGKYDFADVRCDISGT